MATKCINLIKMSRINENASSLPLNLGRTWLQAGSLRAAPEQVLRTHGAGLQAFMACLHAFVACLHAFTASL